MPRLLQKRSSEVGMIQTGGPEEEEDQKESAVSPRTVDQAIRGFSQPGKARSDHEHGRDEHAANKRRRVEVPTVPATIAPRADAGSVSPPLAADEPLLPPEPGTSTSTYSFSSHQVNSQASLPPEAVSGSEDQALIPRESIGPSVSSRFLKCQHPPPQLQRLLETYKVFPRLLVLDLDYTLWPGYVINLGTPLSASPSNQDLIVFESGSSSTNRTLRLFPEARQVLLAMKALGTTLAVASRSPDARQAEAVLRLMGVAEHFSSLQVYRGNKRAHLSTILSAVSINSHEALFFDDEPANIKEARKLGLTAFQVPRASGLDWKALEGGLKAFSTDARGRITIASFFKRKEATP